MCTFPKLYIITCSMDKTNQNVQRLPVGNQFRIALQINLLIYGFKKQKRELMYSPISLILSWHTNLIETKKKSYSYVLVNCKITFPVFNK